MWLLNKISCEIQILNEKVGKLMMENSKLEEENKNLKNDLMQDMKEITKLEKENKKLKAELSKYKKLHKYSNGELLTYKGGELMEEDTLQELRDIGEI